MSVSEQQTRFSAWFACFSGCGARHPLDASFYRCPTCGGLWLDEGEFSRIHQEVKGAKVAPPGWAAAMAQAAQAAQVRRTVDEA